MHLGRSNNCLICRYLKPSWRYCNHLLAGAIAHALNAADLLRQLRQPPGYAQPEPRKLLSDWLCVLQAELKVAEQRCQGAIAEAAFWEEEHDAAQVWHFDTSYLYCSPDTSSSGFDHTFASPPSPIPPPSHPHQPALRPLVLKGPPTCGSHACSQLTSEAYDRGFWHTTDFQGIMTSGSDNWSSCYTLGM